MHCNSILSSGVFLFVASEMNHLKMFELFLMYFKQSIESKKSWKFQTFSSFNNRETFEPPPLTNTASVVCPKFKWTESNIRMLKLHSSQLLENPSIESSITIVVVSSVNHVLLNECDHIFHGCIQLPGMDGTDLLRLYHCLRIIGISVNNMLVLYYKYTCEDQNMFIWDIFYLGDSKIPATCFNLSSSPFLIHR